MQNFSEQNSQIQLMRQQLLHFFHQRFIAKFLPWAIFCLPWTWKKHSWKNGGVFPRSEIRIIS
jgi:hypothetical protein